MSTALFARLQGKYRRVLSATLHCRLITMRNIVPLISFSFDDFPQSALETGGDILSAYGAKGTYYVSLNLLGRDTPTGRICSSKQVAAVWEQGHELGCHTFDHVDAWETEPSSFEESVLANRRTLKHLVPGVEFVTMSYPISNPRPATKERMGRRFAACRGGGQELNVGRLDLNYVRAFFLEQARDSPEVVWNLIEKNRTERGWLVFATHDISLQPTRFGCTPDFFAEVVRRATASGATIVPVGQALSLVRGCPDLQMEMASREESNTSS